MLSKPCGTNSSVTRFQSFAVVSNFFTVSTALRFPSDTVRRRSSSSCGVSVVSDLPGDADARTQSVTRLRSKLRER